MMSSNKYGLKCQTAMNPANLRWQYTIESLIEQEIHTGNIKMVQQLSECLDSLAKFPLVLEKATHCALLNGFDASIITKMTNKLNSSSETSIEDVSSKPLKNLDNWNLSPIPKTRQSPGK